MGLREAINYSTPINMWSAIINSTNSTGNDTNNDDDTICSLDRSFSCIRDGLPVAAGILAIGMFWNGWRARRAAQRRQESTGGDTIPLIYDDGGDTLELLMDETDIAAADAADALSDALSDAVADALEGGLYDPYYSLRSEMDAVLRADSTKTFQFTRYIGEFYQHGTIPGWADV